ncbi:hypothetical protein ACILG0_20250 [Pseudomonadota bacterium AL_CKDN230030165-1A_HGKHYDSX7]
MSPHMSPDDDTEDRDLRGLYRHLPPLEPSPQLDAAIRAQAASAAASDRRARRPHGTWHPGWGVAASVLAVCALLFLTDYSDLANTPTLDSESDETAAVDEEAPQPEIDSQLAAPPPLGTYAPAEPPALPSGLTAPGGVTAPPPPPAAASPSTPAPAPDAAPPAPPPPAPSPEPAAEAASRAERPLARMARPAPRTASPAAEAPAGDANVAPAPTANDTPPMAEIGEVARRSDQAFSSTLPQAESSALGNASPAERAAAEGATPQLSANHNHTVKPPAGPDATSRIEYIRALLRNNQRDNALAQLHSLHDDEPEIELPPDLVALLPAAEAVPAAPSPLPPEPAPRQPETPAPDAAVPNPPAPEVSAPAPAPATEPSAAPRTSP